MRTIIVGIGNPIRSDDSVGLVVARILRERLAGVEGIDVAELWAGGLRLVEAMAGYDRAVVIDAMATGEKPPGTVRRLTLADLRRRAEPYLRARHLPTHGSRALAPQLGSSARGHRHLGNRGKGSCDPERETFPTCGRCSAGGGCGHLGRTTCFPEECDMKVGVYFCRCGGIVSDKIDGEEIRRRLKRYER